MATKLKQLRVTNVALVDRGANPEAHILLYKRDAVTKDDGYSVQPMTTQEVLDYAAQSAAWYRLRSAFMESMYSIEDGASPEEKGPLLLASIEEFAEAARTAFAQMDMNVMLRKRCDGALAAVAKAGRVIAGKRLAALKQAVQSLQKIVEEAEPKPTMKGTGMEKQDTPSIEDVLKRAETAEAQVVTLEKRATDAEAEVVKLQPVDPWAGVSTEVRKRIEAGEERVAKAEAEVRKRDCITQVRLYKALPVNPDDDWEVFDHVNTLLPEASCKRFYALLSAADEGMLQGSMLKRLGHSGSGADTGDGAWGRIKAQAQELVSKGVVKTFPQGVDWVTQHNPDLYAEYEDERQGA